MGNVTSIAARSDSARAEVAASVRAFIARAGVSQSHVAREVGIKQSTFSRRTTGAEPFDTDELGVLADYFEVGIVDLIAGNIDRIAPNAKKAPGRSGSGDARGLRYLSLPDLDSNQEPAGDVIDAQDRFTARRLVVESVAEVAL